MNAQIKKNAVVTLISEAGTHKNKWVVTSVKENSVRLKNFYYPTHKNATVVADCKLIPVEDI